MKLTKKKKKEGTKFMCDSKNSKEASDGREQEMQVIDLRKGAGAMFYWACTKLALRRVLVHRSYRPTEVTLKMKIQIKPNLIPV